MLTTAWYSSFLSAFNSTCVFGYCSVWRMMSEMFCSRRTSALSRSIFAVSGPAASNKNNKLFKITARAGHEGMNLSPCPLLKRCTEESCQGPGWDLLLPWTHPAEVVAAPPITWGSILSPGLAWTLTKPYRNSSGLGYWARQRSGHEGLDWTVKPFSLSIWKHTPFGNFICLSVCVCVHYKRPFVLTFIQASFALSWILTNAKLSPLPADSEEKQQWLTGLHMEISHVCLSIYASSTTYSLFSSSTAD